MSLGWRKRKLVKGVKEIYNSVFSSPESPEALERGSFESVAKEHGFIVSEENDKFLFRKNGKEICLRKNSSDLNVFWQIFHTMEYKSIVDFCEMNGVVLDNIIDLGSNVGFTAIYFKEKYPSIKYICVEPDPGNFSVLTTNVSQFDHIRLYHNAVWHKEANLNLNNSFRDGLEWSRTVSESTDATIGEVKAITIPMLISENALNSVGLLKVDIEGAEFDIFCKSDNLDFLNQVKMVAIEVHEEVGNKEDIVIPLRKYGFMVYDVANTLIGVNLNLVKI